MKISTLFNLLTDLSDILDFFDKVESPEQLVSRLERLKRQGVDDLLSCIEAARGSVTDALHDTLEMSASLDDDEDDDSLLEDADLDALAADDVDGEKSIPDGSNAPGDEKTPGA